MFLNFTRISIIATIRMENSIRIFLFYVSKESISIGKNVPSAEKKKWESFFARVYRQRRATIRKMRDRMFSSNRVFASEVRVQKVSRCDLHSRPNRSSGPLGDAQSEPRGGGSGFEFFPSQYRSWPSTSYSFASCNYTRCAILTFTQFIV